MPVVKYNSNKDPYDGTSRIVLEQDSKGEAVRYVEIGGTIEVSDEELKELRVRYNLAEAKDEEPDPVPGPDASTPTPEVTSPSLEGNDNRGSSSSRR